MKTCASALKTLRKARVSARESGDQSFVILCARCSLWVLLSARDQGSKMILEMLNKQEGNWIGMIFILRGETTPVVVYKYLNA